MLILNDKKIIKKLKNFEEGFSNKNYIYGILKNQHRKVSNFLIWIFMFLILFIFFSYFDVSFQIAFAVGFCLGILISFKNKFCIITFDEENLNMYIFNILMTKVIKKEVLSFSKITIKKLKKTSVFHRVKLLINKRIFDITFSKKVLGLKYQKENLYNFVQKLHSLG